MATITFEYYGGAGPAWTDIGVNTLVFAGSGGLATSINVGSFQDETHIGSGDPGTDQCGANHCPNTRYLGASLIDIGGGSVALSDANVPETDCTFRVHFNHGASVAVSAARLFTFDPGGAETAEALNCQIYAWERGLGTTVWVEINNDTGNIGGDNPGERLTLGTKTAALDHFWYIAASLAPQAVGNINAVDFKVYLTYG